VEEGDPGYLVIEKCGEPQRRDRKERAARPIELVRGDEISAQRPVNRLVVERWYYDTSLNAATVLHLEDGGVTKKERLVREKDSRQQPEE
jgi:hypothetical protein